MACLWWAYLVEVDELLGNGGYTTLFICMAIFIRIQNVSVTRIDSSHSGFDLLVLLRSVGDKNRPIN